MCFTGTRILKPDSSLIMAAAFPHRERNSFYILCWALIGIDLYGSWTWKLTRAFLQIARFCWWRQEVRTGWRSDGWREGWVVSSCRVRLFITSGPAALLVRARQKSVYFYMWSLSAQFLKNINNRNMNYSNFQITRGCDYFIRAVAAGNELLNMILWCWAIFLAYKLNWNKRQSCYNGTQGWNNYTHYVLVLPLNASKINFFWVINNLSVL